PPARRRAAADHLGPRRLGRAEPHARRGRRARCVGHARQRGGAGAPRLPARLPRPCPFGRRSRRGGRGGHRRPVRWGAIGPAPCGRGWGVKLFAALLDRLVYTPQRNGKLRLMTDYFGHAPDPDRGWGLAALTGDLSFHAAKPALIRGLVEERSDPVLFRWSYDYVGDLAETVALIW